MLSEVLSWWLRQLSEVAARCFRLPAKAEPDALLVRIDPPDLGDTKGLVIELARRRRGVVAAPLGRFALDGPGMAAARTALAGRALSETVVLVVAARHILVRDVVLPLAAEREMENVLRYDMDWLTPFPAEKLFWTWKLLRRDPARRQLHLRISLLAKAQLQPVLLALTALGLEPSVLEPASPDGETRVSIPLVQPDLAQLARRRMALRAAVAVPAVLAAALLLLPVVRQSLALAAIDARVAQLRPLVAEADALRRGITANVAGAGVIVAARLHTADALHVLGALTDLLPDDTYLTGFSLNRRKLAIEGQSAAATRLIGALSSHPILRNPAFSAPVIRTETQTEIFSIQAEIGS